MAGAFILTMNRKIRPLQANIFRKNKKTSGKQLIFYDSSCIISELLRGVAKFGIALGSGPRGHG
ncbi:MAG: hypothetical protein ACI4GB_03855, partial [Acutalibacteraceae bacterium]